MEPVRNVAVPPTANVCFDGRCVSHTIETVDGVRKSVGVILPGMLAFPTAGDGSLDIQVEDTLHQPCRFG